MPQIAPPTQPTVSVQVPVPTPVEPAPQPAAARPNQDFLDGYAAALQQQGKGKEKDEEPPADPDAKPAAVSLPPPQPDTDRRQQVVPHTLIFPYLPPPRKRFRPQARYARASVLTGHPEVQSLLRNILPGGRGLHDPLPHGIAADRIEEAGFPAIARHIRESAAGGGTTGGYGIGAEDSIRDYTNPTRSVVGGGQPAMHVSYATLGDKPGTARVHLRLPTGNGFYRAWSSPVLTQQQAAKRVREMAAEGVALMRYPSLHRHRPVDPPGGTDTGRALNTDAKAARRYARYSEIARHPDVIGLLRSHEADPGSHVILADRLEELGLPAVASHLRSANPDSIHASRMAYLPEHMRRPLERGQPVVHWNPVHTPAGDGASAPRLADVRLLLPSGGGGYRAFRMEGIAAPHAARHLRALSHDGVAVHTVSATYPYHEQVVNTDAAARRRMARPRKFARYRDIAAHPDNVGFHQAIAEAYQKGEDNPLPHLVYADWLEDHGHTGMAQIIRMAAEAGPTYIKRSNPVSSLSDTLSTPLEHGQPAVHVYGAYHRGEQRQRQLRGDVRSSDNNVFLHLRIPSAEDPGFYRTWQTPVMSRSDAAGLLRQLKSEGVAHTLSTHHRSASNLDTRQRPNWKVDAFGEGYTTRPPEPPTRFRKRKYAAQRAWATWQSLHPEIRHTPLGAALVHVANGHGGDQTATHLAYAAVHAAGEHDSPMKLEPIGVLADYLEDNNPGHPLARAFNWNGIVNKLELDRLVEAHAAQTAAGKGYTPIGGHDWTQYELNNIAAGSSPESSLHGNLHHAVAAAHAAGISATPEDISRAAERASSRRFGSRDVAHRIWNPDDYHDQVGRQVMADTSPTAITPPDDPRRFARAVAASLGAKT